ncbi:elongation factor 1-beta [Arctopsyche grandis]|uniref:elongation factor 1-beta n=1 Tax=Arctopsyche grandis TaxID=121162 RepID=UPI00406D6BBB
MAFTFENNPKGLEKLNGFLADKSFLSGYQPSKADTSVYDNLGNAPAKTFINILRWYNNIASYSQAERSSFTGQPWSVKGEAKKPAAAPAKAAAPADDDDVDLFASDEDENADAAAVREQRLKEYAEKKSKKPALIAKSSIVLDVKPWDDETDMKEMEKVVRAITMDGLIWGASKLVPVGYGIHKLQVMCVVEDDKVSIDLLTDIIQEHEELVQSVDIAAFNKI